jgi:hypothetical protein
MRSEPARGGLPGLGGRTPWDLLVTAGLGLWFVVTAASQHPNNLFDRLREYDKSSLLIPNWRFFAPEPARHDFHVLHRVLSVDGVETPWVETSRIAPRVWTQAFWHPGGRGHKAVFDVCHDLVRHMQTPELDLTRTPAYRVLQDFVEGTVRASYAGRQLPQGLQFTIARHTGYDQEQDPEFILVSRFVPLTEAAWAT